MAIFGMRIEENALIYFLRVYTTYKRQSER